MDAVQTILGCAMYVDILKPPSLLSLSLQGCELDMVLGIKNILRAITAAPMSLARQDPVEWPTIKLLLGRIKDGGEKLHQGAAFKNFSPATQMTLKEDTLHHLTELDEKVR